MSEDTQEKKDSGTESKNNFIREKVEPPKKRKKRHLFLRLLLLLIGGVIFGLVACLSFVLSKPWIEERFGVVEETTEAVVIPRDEETTAAESALSKEDVKALVNAGIRSYMETFNEVIKVEAQEEPDILDTAGEALANSIVTVISKKDGEDVFQNPYTSSNQTFGLILAKTKTELLILTESELLQDAGVLVAMGSENVSAVEKAEDGIYGMAVIAVAKTDVPDDLWETLMPASLGNSYSVRQGDTVAAFGSPMGYTGSTVSGTVAFINTMQQDQDRNIQVIQTNISADRNASGLLVNKSGQIIGWITQRFSSESMSGLLAAVSISDVKGYIENMTNGRDSGYLGIRFRTVTTALMEEQGMPEGIYITKCINDSPAFEAGLQNGDILTAIGGEMIRNEYDFERVMEGLFAGDSITVTVMRQGRNGYTEMKYEVALTFR